MLFGPCSISSFAQIWGRRLLRAWPRLTAVRGSIRECPTSRHARLGRTLLCNGSRQGGVSHAPLSGDRTGTLPLGKALTSDAPLQIGQLGLATHVNPTLAGSGPALVGTLHDPLTLVQRLYTCCDHAECADYPSAG
jgi:hypothetical protein